MKFQLSKGQIAIAGIVMGLGMALLAYLGNPANMALCTACFIRDQVGAMNMHQNAGTMYFRPEIVGLLVGSFTLAMAGGKRATTASAPGIRFLGGVILMVNSLVFLGCTLRMVLRLSAGDMSALGGLLGLILGVVVGIFFIKQGYTLGKEEPANPINAWGIPLTGLILFALFLIVPDLFNFSEAGPGSLAANPWAALAVGLVVGGLGFVTRLCFVGAFRDIILIRDFSLFIPVLMIFLVMLGYNYITGNFELVAFGPIAHNQHLWNVLSMFAVGLGGVLFGACPVRQVILAGSGSGNATVTVAGMFVGAAFAHNFGLAAAPSVAATADAAAVAGGPGLNGQVFVIGSIIFLFVLGFYVINHNKKQA